MFIVDNYTTAILFCFVTMLCWGSWANTQKLAASSWRFELFYWDYVLGILATALVFSITLGNEGTQGRGFFEDIQQASRSSIGSAMIGGIIFNAANILLVAAIAVAGMSVAFPVGIGIALVWGVVVNYLTNPAGNSLLLFLGVGLIVIAILLNAYAYRRASATRKKVSTRGLLLSVLAGVLMGFFYKYVAASMFPDFTIPEPGKLSPYTAVFFFALGILLSNFLFNSILMRRPVAGPVVKMSDYFHGSMRNHLMGMLGGAIWCVGMSLSILASGKAGPAISYGLGQGATVVAAVWGIFIWKEFRGSPRGTKPILYGMLLCYLVGLGVLIAAIQKPVSIILDTDIGPDYDDVGAMAVLHALADKGEARPLAIMASNKDPLVAPTIDALNTYFGRSGLPVGAPKGNDAPDKGAIQHWPEMLLQKYPHQIKANGDAPDAVRLYRKILAAEPDHSVTIVTIGFLTNLAHLLHSGPDEYSRLTGEELVSKKVSKLVSMAGRFPEGREFNILIDSAASARVFLHWPTPVIFSGFEIGKQILTGKELVADAGLKSPVKDVFAMAMAFSPEDHEGRMSWDETAVLTAIRGTEPFFGTHKGQITLHGGHNGWWDDLSGNQVYLTMKMPAEDVRKIIEDLMRHRGK